MICSSPDWLGWTEVLCNTIEQYSFKSIINYQKNWTKCQHRFIHRAALNKARRGIILVMHYYRHNSCQFIKPGWLEECNSAQHSQSMVQWTVSGVSARSMSTGRTWSLVTTRHTCVMSDTQLLNMQLMRLLAAKTSNLK